jgi:hypothetical protein
VRRDVRAALRALVVPTVALAVIGSLVPGRLTLAIRIYALLVCAAALALALSALRRSYPRARPLRSPRKRTTDRRRPPSSLGRIEHEAALGVAGAFDLHFRLVPRIRSIAAGLVASRRRLVLDADPDATRRLLGAETWELVREGRSIPDDRLARGLAVADLRRVVESLERI